MLTTIDLPDALYRESEALAAVGKGTVEQLIVESVAEFVRAPAIEELESLYDSTKGEGHVSACADYLVVSLPKQN